MPKLYGHPFSSFTWKALIALYERDVPFEFMMLGPDHPENAAFVARHTPTGQFPVLADGDRVVIESAAIIEYLDLHHGDAPPLVPRDPVLAIEARQMDGVFDDYVMIQLQRLVSTVLREADKRDPHMEGEVETALAKSYAFLDRWMTGRTWAANDAFSIADVAAAPALFYANWAIPIPSAHKVLRAYGARLFQRPSIKRVIDEARPYRTFFPLPGRGDPDLIS